MRHSVIWRESAIADLKAIFHWTADQVNADVALRYVQRIEAAGDKLADFPNRGSPRDDIGPGLRSITATRSATIFYSVEVGEVRIVRVLHPRRDQMAAFEDE